MMEGVLRSATPGSQPLSLSHTRAHTHNLSLCQCQPWPIGSPPRPPPSLLLFAAVYAAASGRCPLPFLPRKPPRHSASEAEMVCACICLTTSPPPTSPLHTERERVCVFLCEDRLLCSSSSRVLLHFAACRYIHVLINETVSTHRLVLLGY